MSSQVLFVPEEMYGFSAEASSMGGSLREEGGAVDDALDRFRSSSSEFVPSLPAHGASIEGIAERVVALGDGVGALGEAAEEADRRGMDLAEALLAAGGAIRLADTLTQSNDALQNLLRFSVYSVRAVRESLRPMLQRARWGSRPMPRIDRVRSSLPGGERLPRAEVRRIQMAQYRRNQRALADARRAGQAARSGMRARPPLTTIGGRVRNFMQNTRTGRALGFGGRALGVVGAGLQAYDAYSAFREGDVEEGVTKSVGAVGGAMMMTGTPVGVVVGGTLVVGSLIYEHREAIGQGISDAAGAIEDVGSDLVEGAGKVLDGIF